jgi:hypothetical protein
MEFKMKNQHLGQIRVYILPDDVGRGSIDRQQSSLRKAMQFLITQMDISKATWRGAWSDDIPVAHIDSSLDSKEDASLFYLFNKLPSPKPVPEIVVDRYAREAMYRILDSDIEGLTTKMHLYQRRSAALMLQREAQPSQIIDPRLRPVIDQKGFTWYCDVDAGSCLREPRTYDAAKGGICAETMGLGKTLICLALILATRELSSQIPVEYSVGTIPVRQKTGSLKDMAAATIGRTGTPWRGHFAGMEAEGYDFSQCLQAIRKGAGYYYLPGPVPRRESRNPVVVPPRKIWLTTATIVVVPPNLVQQWRHEIKKHTVGLKVLVMNSNKAKLPPAKELAEFDVILFSKPRFDKEAKDGADDQGRRRTTTNSVCRCPYIGSTRERDCTCFKEEDAYRSPLKDLHFKRLITDEGHNFGNASSSSRTEAVTVVEFLQLSSRWIVSGTPTQGLYGTEVGLGNSEGSSMSNTPLPSDSDENTECLTGTISSRLLELPDSSDAASETSSEQEKAYQQERKDLEKLGNIATMYLKARPWANTQDDNDVAAWSQYVMMPRHRSKSRGNMDCLKSTLESMIIRHRPEDISLDVTLPPLHQTVVYLDGSLQDKLSLNMFSMMIISNAITSERKDNDYLFHPRQRKALQLLVSNLRQASFYWSGYSREDVQVTIDIARKFLEEKKVPVTAEDEILLKQAIQVGETILSNPTSKAISKWHEMPMYIENECPEDIRGAWALDEDTGNPTLMGATMIHAMHDFVSKQLWKENPMDGLVEEGKKVLSAAYLAQHPPPNTHSPKATSKNPKLAKKAIEQAAPALAGGVSVGDGSTPRKRARAHSVGTVKSESVLGSTTLRETPWASETAGTGDVKEQLDDNGIVPKPKSALKKSKVAEVVGTLDQSSPLASTAIVSTSSAKLSYLVDRIIAYQSTEKIIVFYEADNVAYYIAQALEILGVEHLIYAKSLASSRRSDYVVTFNQTETFRVLLMDVSQAAFGLDMSSASRVFFVNPVFSPQIEAQAVKRAHRIGQTKPVFVETLVLKGSIEEVILERRKDMSTEEHNKCKSILDDQTMYDWIRNVRFLPLPTNDVPGPDQMAKLETPQLVFGRGVTRIGERDPDADLVLDSLSPKAKSKKRAKKASFADDDSTASSKAKGKRTLAFAVREADGYIEPTTSDDEAEQKQEEEDIKRETKLKFKRKSVSFEGTGTCSMLFGRHEDPFRVTDSPNHCPSGRMDDHDDNSLIPPMLTQPLNRSSSTVSSPFSTAPLGSGSSFFGVNSPSALLLRLVNSQPPIPTRNPSASSSMLLGQAGPQMPPTPAASFSLQPPNLRPLAPRMSSTDDNDEIEYSTPRPRSKRPRTELLGVKVPGGGFEVPPRNYTTSSSRSALSSNSPSPASSSSSTSNSSLGSSGLSGMANGELASPSKAQRARQDPMSLMVRLKMGHAMKKLQEVEGKSNAWRAEMSASGARVGKRGWERTNVSEVPVTKKSMDRNNWNAKNDSKDGDAEKLVS